MRNIKLTLAYDGTDFHGWQIQPDCPTVQGTLRDVVQKLTGEAPAIHAAGRTDAGVHALGQVAHFRTESRLRAAEFQRACNALLPPAVRVVAAEEVALEFHARWHALSKTYRYRIFRGRIVPPFEWRYVLHDPCALNVEAMVEAARLFEGEHDFASFAASTGSEEDDRERTTVRTIDQSVWMASAEGDWLTYSVRGRSFLRSMVRKIVGTLLEVGHGRLSAPDIPRLFALRDRARSGPTVPPQGLYLVSVEYPQSLASPAEPT